MWKEGIRLGIAPIGWTNDDMPALGGENTFEQCISEMALAGFTGCEVGSKYPKDPEVLKEALTLRGMRIASKWFSSFLVTQPFEANRRAFEAELDFLAAMGADRINVSEQSFSIRRMCSCVMTPDTSPFPARIRWPCWRRMPGASGMCT